MRVPQSWLTEVLDRGTPGWEASAEEIDAGFVRVGLEIEDVHRIDAPQGPLVIGRVESIEELTGFKKPIRFCRVEVGEAEPRGIVCGARNFAEGDLVVVALPGAVLPGGFAIAARKTYGHTSDGMICSAAELALGTDHSGIMVLAPGTAEPGADAIEVLGLPETVFEVNVTPDRGYCLSVRGLTRELACGFDLEYSDPAKLAVSAGDAEVRPVTVADDSGCVRFSLRLVEGIDPKATTPWWIQRRLLFSGIRPISPAVDVTNYVMLELGHPLHAFDSGVVSGGFTVRRAAAGETLRTLDDVERTLDPEDVVIADDSGAVSLAGVMGGLSTEVSGETTNVLLEAAIWNPLAVFRTARRHKLPSEAARRYERTVDSGLSAVAVTRAAQLLVEIAGGTLVDGITDVGEPIRQLPVDLPIDLPDRVAGVHYPNGAAAQRLAQIGCAVDVKVGDDGHGILVVTPPTWRSDLLRPADLVEEVVRLEGLEQIPPVLPAAPAGRGLTAVQRRRRSVGRTLAAEGFVEVLPTVFLPAGVFDTWGLDADDPRRTTTSVLNPLEADRAELATTLLPGLLEITRRNLSRGRRDLALFAIASVVQPGPSVGAVEPIPVDRRPTDEEIARLENSLPDQPQHVAGVLTGQVDPAGYWGPGRPVAPADAFEAVRAILAASGVEGTFEHAEYLPFHPGRCARILVDGTPIGYAGELHPAVLERSDLPPRTCALELNLDAIPIVESRPAPKVSPFPAVHQDVAVVVDRDVPAADVEAALRAGAGDLLEDLRLFDVYTGDRIAEGKKSLAYALRFRGFDRTLTEDDATAARTAAVAAAGEAVGAVLR